MKKIAYTAILLSTIFFVFSCKTDKKKPIDKNTITSEFTIDQSSISANWTAYKTTDKVAVKGEFKEIKLNKTTASTAKEFLNNLEFSIPVSSIFSNNDDRDSKLIQFFFGAMLDTELLSGTIMVSPSTNGIINLNMNSISKSFAITYTVKDDQVTIAGILNLEDWNAQNAIESLNKACFDLHKGADGVSKTWNEVKLDISFAKVK